MLPSSIAICIFWLFYLLRSTFFAGWGGVSGLFYPLYLLIVAIAVRNFLARAKPPEVRLWLSLYFVFLLTVVFSMYRSYRLYLDFQTFQLLFIYSLGAFSFYQFVSARSWRLYRWTTVCASGAATLWVIYTSLTASSVTLYRGGLEVDANYVSMIIMIGTLVVSGRLLESVSLRRRLLIIGWMLLAFYAMSILGSRGMSIALLIGLLVLFFNSLRQWRMLAAMITLVVLVLVVLPALPGSDMLVKRFGGANIETLNGRIELWQECLRAFAQGSLSDMLFGHGFRASEQVVASISGRILTSTHNGFLRILVEQGVAGLLLLLTLIGVMLRRLWQLRATDVGILALAAALLVSNLSISSSDGFIFWIVLGVCAAFAFQSRPGERGAAWLASE